MKVFVFKTGSDNRAGYVIKDENYVPTVPCLVVDELPAQTGPMLFADLGEGTVWWGDPPTPTRLPSSDQPGGPGGGTIIIDSAYTDFIQGLMEGYGNE